MASDSEHHWHATCYPLMVGPIPGTFFLPWPVLPFWHPWPFILASLVWMVLVIYLSRQGLAVSGLKVIIRRWFQGSRLTPRRSGPKPRLWR